MVVVRATGVAVGRREGVDESLAKQIEGAMIQAVKDCHTLGIRDDHIIREAMMIARSRVLDTPAVEETPEE